MARIDDRVKETTLTTGTGPYVLVGPLPRFIAFGSVVPALDGQSVYYAIEDSASDFEVGRGTYSFVGNSISRDEIILSSNSNLAVNWGAGTKIIWMNAPSRIMHESLGDDDHPQYVLHTEVDDVPVNGATADPISSNWAFDHENASDPHPQYLTAAEGAAAFDALGAAAAAVSAHEAALDPHPQYLTAAEGNAAYDALGAAAAAVSAHEAALDPHPQYATDTDITQPSGQIVVGDGSGITSFPEFTYDASDGSLTFAPLANFSPGNISLTAAGCDDIGAGGAIVFTGGAGGLTSGDGGDITLLGGTAPASGEGGDIQILGGLGFNSSGGDINILAGSDAATGPGGGVTITGGTGGVIAGNAGPVVVQGGTPNDGNGGDVFLVGSNGNGTDRNGGNVSITAGLATGAGIVGSVRITTGGAERLEIRGDGGWELGNVEGTSGQVLTSGGAGSPPTWTTPATVITDHGGLTGLGDDDHPQYVLHTEVDDVPVNGATADPISSNWAFDHENAVDPHPQYLTAAEGAAAFDALGAAAGAVSSHEAAGDPHPGYRLESADHSHQSTGLQGGQLDHGLALTGLGDDDHPQYTLADGTRAFTGSIEFSPDNTHNIGAPGADRPATGHFGTSLFSPVLTGSAAAGLTLNVTQGAAVSTGGVVSITSGVGGATSGDSGTVDIASGTTTDGNTGAITIKTGNAAGVGKFSGNLSLQTGSVTDGVAGSVFLVAGNNVNNSGGNVFIAAGDSTSGGGGIVTITGGDTNSSNAGDVLIQTGSNTGTGSSGVFTLQTGTTVSGATGTIAIQTGNAGGVDMASGEITIASGAATGTGVPGAINITAGPAGTGTGGVINVTAGSGNATGTGGALTISSGPGGATSGASGAVTVKSGTTTDGDTGTVTIKSATPLGTNRGSGAIIIQTGAPTGSGVAGTILLKTADLTRLTVTALGNIELANKLGVDGQAASASTSLATPAATTAKSSIRIPHGAAPTTPVNGDVWSTAAGVFARINGVTVGPFGAGGTTNVFFGGASFAAPDAGLHFRALASNNATPQSLGNNSNTVIPKAGTVKYMTWHTAAGDAATVFKIVKNGAVAQTITLTGAAGAVSSGTVAVVAGDTLAVEYDAGTAPGNSSVILFME